MDIFVFSLVQTLLLSKFGHSVNWPSLAMLCGFVSMLLLGSFIYPNDTAVLGWIFFCLSRRVLYLEFNFLIFLKLAIDGCLFGGYLCASILTCLPSFAITPI